MNWLYLLPFPLLYFSVSNALDYSDLESIGVSCPDRDSCGYMNHASNRPTFENRSCECDPQCRSNRDCCIDSGHETSRRASQRRPILPCLPFGGVDNVGAFMVNKCRRDYNGPSEIRRQCERSNNISDPLVRAPVTDTANRITYSSRYCAECNGAQPENLSSWMIGVSCESLKQIHSVSDEYIFGSLVYRARSNQWGVNHWDNDTESTEFYACDILFDMPSYLVDDVRQCRHNIISACPSNWTRGVIRRNCGDYMAVVFVGIKVYKNPHCAICNGVEVGIMTCERAVVSRGKQPVSFALLLDVNRSDGEIVGMSQESTPSCSANKRYDTFGKRCRSLSCPLPGMYRVNNRCERRP